MNDIELFTHTPPPVGLEISPTREALAARDALLAGAFQIQSVTAAEENDRCSAMGSDIQTQIKRTEKIGLELRRPYNSEADKIKAVQDAYLAPLRPHLKRLGSLAAAYRTEEERQARIASLAREKEIIRLQEQQRQAAEDARKAAEKGDLMGELEADIGRQALSDLTNAAIASPEPETIKTAGQSFRADDFDFECTDPVALWNARPELCNGPTPKRSAIKACCSVGMVIPGLRFFPTPKVNFKQR